MTNNQLGKLTKRDVNRAGWRFLLQGQSAWNYEKMQGLGYCHAMLPALKKIYKDPQDLKESVQQHLQFYNSHQFTSCFIIGANLALEEEKGREAKEAVPAIKTGLMGPLAGLGDTFFTVTLDTIFGAIAAYMALHGDPTGCIIWLIFNLFRIFIVGKFAWIGYTQGRKIVTSVGSLLKNITDSSVVLGITVIGALIPTVVKIKVPFTYTSGELTIKMQDVLNQVMPGLLPVCFVFFTYWLLGRKRMTSTKVIFILVALGLGLSWFGILG